MGKRYGESRAVELGSTGEQLRAGRPAGTARGSVNGDGDWGGEEDGLFFSPIEWMTVSGCARGGHRTAGATIGRRRQGLKTQANPRFIENQKNVKDIFLMFFLQLRDKFL